MKTLIAAITLLAAAIAVPSVGNAEECTTVDYQGAPLELCPPVEPDPTNCYLGDYQGAPIEVCMPTGWTPDPSWTFQGAPIVMYDSTVQTAAELKAAGDAWMASHECWIDDNPNTPIPQGEFVTYNTRTEPGSIGSHSVGGTPCGYPVGSPVTVASSAVSPVVTPEAVPSEVELSQLDVISIVEAAVSGAPRL
jgi:hypothetical protein